MIYVTLMGGLGNQMFQFAAGRSLSVRLNTPIKVDLSFLKKRAGEHYTQRNYELQAFQGAPKEVGFAGNFVLFLAKKYPKISRLVPFFPKLFGENGLQFHTDFNTIRSSVILLGYWQSEKYFNEIRSTLLEDFQRSTKLSPEVKKTLDEITKTPVPVSIHFRRGDYVTLASAAAVHGTTPTEYYSRAIQAITSKFPKAFFFLFSDDTEWVRKNFSISNSKIMSGFNAIDDLFLMSSCQHNIIANSSFSWWAAWLNQYSNKTVIAPKQWFRDQTISAPDLIPDRWILL